MKTDRIEPEFEGENRRRFTGRLLEDLRALEQMLAEGMLEGDPARVGAEQEMFLVDASRHPAPAALDMLAKLDDPHFTTELGMFNLELNLDPHRFGGDCLQRMERELEGHLERARRAAGELGVEIVLTGILPTLRKSDLGRENMVPKARYRTLDKVMMEMRGGAPYQIHIKGLDEILLEHDSVMVEACNCSFQVHFQAAPADFPNLYNIAQVVAGPVLACATNSPLLFGRRLWAETRTALFQQSVDTRSPSTYLRDSSPRVTFGTGWVRRSVLELYREDVARFRALIGADVDEDPFALLAKGEAPGLPALRLFNGTVYRWNRACYGITSGRPHLRIENRVLPAGPSVVDEVANGAFWLGLIRGLHGRHEDITREIEFEQAQLNFTNAARQGLGATLAWLGGEELSAPALILDRLLPLAGEGLDRGGVRPEDRDRYLGVIERRVRSGRTGSRWLLQSLQSMKERGTAGERLNALTSATIARQRGGHEVSAWELARLEEAGGWRHNYLKVEQIMTTDLFTVHGDDSIELVANLIDWNRLRYVPVEDHRHQLIGLVSHRGVLRALGGGRDRPSLAVADIMKREVVTVSPATPTLEAIELLRERRIGCLPVVEEGRLVGIVTARDFMDIAGQLLAQGLEG